MKTEHYVALLSLQCLWSLIILNAIHKVEDRIDILIQRQGGK